MTLPTANQNSVKPPSAQDLKRLATDESCEEPMPLPDAALSHSVLQGQPNEPTKAPVKPGSLEIPDDVPLAPLDPPK
jgi:hypothetical protein